MRISPIVLCVLLPVVACQIETANLNIVLVKCSNLLNQFEQKYVMMKRSIRELQAGIGNLQNRKIQDNEIQGQVPLIREASYLLSTLPPNAVDHIKASDALRLLGSLGTLKKILPSNPAAFENSVSRHGGVGGLLAAAYVPIKEVISTLGGR